MVYSLSFIITHYILITFYCHYHFDGFGRTGYFGYSYWNVLGILQYSPVIIDSLKCNFFSQNEEEIRTKGVHSLSRPLFLSSSRALHATLGSALFLYTEACCCCIVLHAQMILFQQGLFGALFPNIQKRGSGEAGCGTHILFFAFFEMVFPSAAPLPSNPSPPKRVNREPLGTKVSSSRLLRTSSVVPGAPRCLFEVG